MNLVVAVDKNWAIGNKGQLLVHIPEDMKNFRRLTEGHKVVLGRKTLTTFPNGKPLKNRENIVLSRKNIEPKEGMRVVGSLEELLEAVKEYKDEEIYVIGGSSVYEQLLPYVDTAYVTYIDYAYEADAFFPNLDLDEAWIMTETSEEQTYFDVEYYFRKYERRKL